MILKTLIVGQLQSNCYIVGDQHTRQGMVIDPGGDAEVIIETVEELALTIERAVLTHFHFDHVLAAESVRDATGASLAIHAYDAGHLTNPPELFRFFAPQAPHGLQPDLILHDGDRFAIGEIDIRVIHTPGHSPGGISLWLPDECVVFSGDTLFREGVGRTDFPGCSQADLVHSIRQRLYTLSNDTAVYPGHGPATTIGHERTHNPWVSG